MALQNESLSSELAATVFARDQLEVEVTKVNGELKMITEAKNSMEEMFVKKIDQIESQMKNVRNIDITLIG